LLHNVFSAQPVQYKFPKHFSSNIKDLCRNLIQHDRTRRFGNLKGGVNDVKNHPWFREVNWVQVYQRKASICIF